MAPSIFQQPSASISQACHLVLSHPYLLLLSLAFAYFLRNKYLRGIYSIPGPSFAAWTSLWRLWNVYCGEAHLDAIRLHRKHGNIVRIAPNVVSVGDRAEIPNIYGRGEAYTKTAFYPIQSISWQKKPAMNAFSERDPAAHRNEKRKIAGAFSLGNILQSEDRIDECGMLLMQQLGEQFASKGDPVDLGCWLQYYAFDVIGELTFAKKFGFLERGEDVDGMMGIIEGQLKYAALTGQIPWMHRLLLGNPILTLLMPAMETWNQVLLFTLKAMNSRASIKRDGDLLNADVGGRDMLSRWAYVKNNDPLKMNTRSIVIHASGNVFAGSDTTAIALRSIIYHLLKAKDEMDKVVSEIDAANKERKLSQPIAYKESIEHLPYLGAAIKEAMRLHSSVGLLMERHVPSGGATICRKHIPGGTIVGINPWVTNRDPSVFPDPDTFNPSRWLSIPADRLREMDSIWQLIFGAGSRVCMGRHISLIEIHKVVPQLLRTFTLELDPPEREWRVRNYWFTQQKGLVCRLRKR